MLNDRLPVFQFITDEPHTFSSSSIDFNFQTPCFFPQIFFFLFRSSHSFPGLSGDRGRSLFQSPEEDPRSWNPHLPPHPSSLLSFTTSPSHIFENSICFFSFMARDTPLATCGTHIRRSSRYPKRFKKIQDFRLGSEEIFRECKLCSHRRRYHPTTSRIRNPPLSSRAQANNILPSPVFSILSTRLVTRFSPVFHQVPSAGYTKTAQLQPTFIYKFFSYHLTIHFHNKKSPWY